MSKIYWNRMEEMPVVGPLSPGRIGVLENECGDVVGFVGIEFFTGQGLLTCRKIYDTFCLSVQFEIAPHMPEIVLAGAVKSLFGDKLEYG